MGVLFRKREASVEVTVQDIAQAYATVVDRQGGSSAHDQLKQDVDSCNLHEKTAHCHHLHLDCFNGVKSQLLLSLVIHIMSKFQ